MRLSSKTENFKGESMGEYEAYFKTIVALTDDERRAMASLYLAHYDGSNENLFFADLKSKTEALIVQRQNVLVGFTTLQVYEHVWERRLIRVVYSGDTVVDRAHWGQQALAFAWITRMGELQSKKPYLPMYWFLIVKGHRTFRYLPTFSKSFYPHWSLDRSNLKPLADALAREKFGDDYNSTTGVVEFPESKGHLKTDIAFPAETEKKKDAVKYFLERNPNYLRGHELVCLCELTEENLKPLAKRLFLRKAGYGESLATIEASRNWVTPTW
jgi:hypothetical protein